MDIKERSLILVTVLDSQPLISESWMKANRCARVGDNAFLFYDKITLEQAEEKFIGFVGPNAAVNAFPVGMPFLYQGKKVVEDGLNRILAE